MESESSFSENKVGDRLRFFEIIFTFQCGLVY